MYRAGQQDRSAGRPTAGRDRAAETPVDPIQPDPVAPRGFGGRITFLGFRLIAGSVAMALRARARETPAGAQEAQPFGLAAGAPRDRGPPAGPATRPLGGAPPPPAEAPQGREPGV